MGSINTSDHLEVKYDEEKTNGVKECPSCGHKLDGKPDWLGLPAGVKFDPTDQELIEHLEAKVEGVGMMKSHYLIDEFIPTIEGDDGICYTHPEKLPGVTRDGLNRHFFHRPSRAYTTGTRKRRKIQVECDSFQGGETRWHKTGKTRPVIVNGRQKGCKKILVLYNFGKNRKPEKTNWVMHQYHLGQLEEEKEGELVVSKIFYQTQPRQCNWSDRAAMSADAGAYICSRTAVPMQIIREEMSPSGVAIAATISSCSSMAVQSLKTEHLCFPPFSKSFDHEVRVADGSTVTDVATASGGDDLREHHSDHHRMDQHQQHHFNLDRHISKAQYHVTVSPNPMSAIMPSIVLNQDPGGVPEIMLRNEIQHQENQMDHQHDVERSSALGLEELILSCSSNDIKQTFGAGTAEAEWLKFPSFWPDADHHAHHG